MANPTKRGKYKTYYEDANLQLPRSTKYNLQRRSSTDDESSIDDMQEYENMCLAEREDAICEREDPSQGNDDVGTNNCTCNNDDAEENNGIFNETKDAEIPEIAEHSGDATVLLGYDETFNIDESEEHVPIDDRIEDTFEDFDFHSAENSIDNDMELYVEEEMQENLVNKCVKSFSALNQMLKDDDSNKIIDASLAVSQCEVLLGILKYSLHYSLPNSATEDLCKMVNSFFNGPIIPDTRYRINKIFTDNGGVDNHAVCPKCNIYLQKFDRGVRSVHCGTCNSDIPVKGNNGNFFVVLNTQNEIQHLIESNGKYYDFIVNRRERTHGHQRDIYDGLLYKRFVQSLPPNERNSYATCSFNSDGSPVFKSSTFSIWPIQVIINELPVNVRTNKPITCALWFGKNKPKMNLFMETFIDSTNKLSNEGFSCTICNEIRHIKLYPICCCVDSVARAPMQGIVQFNGYYGCNWCLHPGVLVLQKTKRTIKYPLLDYVPLNRTEVETYTHMQETLQSLGPVYGVKRASALLKLNRFNIVRGFVPDSMHCISLGICRQFANYWFTSSNNPYSLNNKIKLIDEILASLKVPSQLARLSRSINEKKYWKAREWENWLLHYSIPILNLMPNFRKYCKHWALLVDSIHILMSSSISIMELLRAEDNLKKFVAKTESLYSRKAMTFNVHQLLHLCQSVIDWGPLWSHTGYGFETGNGKIVRNVKAAKGVIHQICRQIDFQQSAEILEKHVRQQENSPIIEFCNYLEFKETKNTEKLFNCRYFGKASFVKQQWIENLQLSKDFTVSYFRMVKNNCLFSSSERTALRTSNCFAETSEGVFIKIIEFLVDSENYKQFTICQKITTDNLTYCDSVKKVVNINEELVAIDTDSIESIAVFMQIRRKQYITSVPNMYHY